MFNFFRSNQIDDFYKDDSDFEILDNIIDYNCKLESDFKKEYERNLIRVQCCFLFYILAINYFSYYISINFNTSIEDID